MDPTKKQKIKCKSTKFYIDEVYRLAIKKPGVQHVLILNEAGVPVKTSMSNETAIQNVWIYGKLRQELSDLMTNMHVFKTHPEVKIIRIRTKQDEIIIAPDGKFTVLVIQKSPDASIIDI